MTILQILCIEHFCLRNFRCDLKFAAPAVPIVPSIAITVNIYLILKLSYLTLIRFVVWMTLGEVPRARFIVCA